MQNTYRHKKSGDIYTKIGEAINATNSVDGQIEIIYTKGSQVFVREKKEFEQKFEPIVGGNSIFLEDATPESVLVDNLVRQFLDASPNVLGIIAAKHNAQIALEFASKVVQDVYIENRFPFQGKVDELARCLILLKNT